MPSENAYIFDAIRTPRGRGRRDGALHEFKPVTILASLLRSLQQRNGFDTGAVSDVVMGVVTPLGEQGGVIPKSAAQLAGWDESVCGLQVNRFCASGLEAINIAAQRVMAGAPELMVAGGVESMSRVAMGSDGGPWQEDPETAFKVGSVPQGISADLIASVDGYSRHQLDEWAVRSHERAAKAGHDGAFKSLIPFQDGVGLPVLARDELVRANCTSQALAKLEPSFVKMGAAGFDDIAVSRFPAVRRVEHVHTAGNSSGIADGASAVLIGSRAAGEKQGLRPRARIAATAVVCTDPTLMLTGPAPATRKLLAQAGLSIADVDLFECNEAFAVVVLRYIKELGLDEGRVNVNGGAIAMGHPLGATGGVLVSMLLDELERRDRRRGVVTLCAGGGMGIATLIERV
ncbi:acetyl-CoA C-acetyltransferase [Panacagrimonas perspica]|uniref:Acetyl-CoA C-acetyltransferase n=1 Tax=Panacagrimonas perspica TaxID=381431 RepID=A0A4R7NUN6_9GAMM|nr:acetyl-CoA C-acetyltransferase [Panacagrimonas perspica]TDU24200.1 acetyl-CoA C-acetyltransferase [Panacagrimonas perspica]THD04612.1 acetyl-CoA acetyltransferase [Panacagrimonas perspica]